MMAELTVAEEAVLDALSENDDLHHETTEYQMERLREIVAILLTEYELSDVEEERIGKEAYEIFMKSSWTTSTTVKLPNGNFYEDGKLL